MSMKVLARPVGLLATFAVLATGCQKAPEPPAATAPVATAPEPPAATAPVAPVRRSASATIAGLGGNPANGTITFKESPSGVDVEVHLYGLTPGRHGFHIHQVGDCSGDGTPAGDHFNPAGHPHAGPDSATAHAGDFGNVVADDTGHAMMTMTSRHITLDDPVSGVVGRSVVVHASEDDLTTQPSGNSGARIGCGVIKMDGAAGMTAPAGEAPAASAPTGASAP